MEYIVETSVERKLQLVCKDWNKYTCEYTVKKWISTEPERTKPKRNFKRHTMEGLKRVLRNAYLVFGLYFIFHFLFYHQLKSLNYLNLFTPDPYDAPPPEETMMHHTPSPDKASSTKDPIRPFSLLKELIIYGHSLTNQLTFQFIIIISPRQFFFYIYNLYRLGYLLFGIYFLALYYYLHYHAYVIEESVLIMKNLGIQIVITYRNGRSVRKFIPLSEMSKPYMNEALKGLQVSYFLILGLCEESRLCVLFKNFKPPRPMLFHVYKAIRTMLFNKGSSCLPAR